MRHLLAESSSWAEASGHRSNYMLMLEHLDAWRQQQRPHWEVAVVSLNYDTLIERAFEDVLLRSMGRLENYIDGAVCLLKPHGSANWLREIHLAGAAIPDGSKGSYEDEANAVIRAAPRWEEGEEYEVAAINKTHFVDERWAVPAMSLPLDEKTQFMWPAPHRQRMEESVRRTRLVITVGWQATERELLKKHLSRLLAGIPIYVCTRRLSHSQEIADAMQTAGIKGAFWPQEAPFTELAKGPILSKLLPT